MTSGLTSLIFTIGFSCWLYYKLLNRTGGGNPMAAGKATAAVAVAVFLVLYSMLRFVLKF